MNQVNSALHPSGVAKSSTSFGWGKGGKVTAAGSQVTLCDPVWHVISCSGEMISITNCYIRVYFYFTLQAKKIDTWKLESNMYWYLQSTFNKTFCWNCNCCHVFTDAIIQFALPLCQVIVGLLRSILAVTVHSMLSITLMLKVRWRLMCCMVASQFVIGLQHYCVVFLTL